MRGKNHNKHERQRGRSSEAWRGACFTVASVGWSFSAVVTRHRHRGKYISRYVGWDCCNFLAILCIRDHVLIRDEMKEPCVQCASVRCVTHTRGGRRRKLSQPLVLLSSGVVGVCACCPDGAKTVHQAERGESLFETEKTVPSQAELQVRMMPPLTKLLAAAVTAAAAAAAAATTSDDGGGRAFRLRPESDLSSHCFDFPANSFDRKRCVCIYIYLFPPPLLYNGHTDTDRASGICTFVCARNSGKHCMKQGDVTCTDTYFKVCTLHCTKGLRTD